MKDNYPAAKALKAAIGTGMQEYIDTMLGQAHRICVLPRTRECIDGVFRSLGFVSKSGDAVGWGMKHFCEYLNEKMPADTIAIAKLYGYCAEEGYVPVTCGPEGFVPLYGPEMREGQSIRLTGAWIYAPEKARAAAAKPSKSRAARIPADTESFRYLQLNPAGRTTGDCSVRTIAAVLDCSWHEALDMMILAMGGEATEEDLDRFFREKGFQRFEAELENGKAITGAELCERLRGRLKEGQSCAVQLGPSHIAAILPEEDGRCRICDSWDSSGKKAGAYWIR